MKRQIAIAAATAAVLVGGATAATVAWADDGADDRDRTRSSSAAGTGAAGRDTAGDRTASDAPASGRITVDRAVAAALKAVPGTVTGAEWEGPDDDGDDDRDRPVWELDVYGADKAWHDVTVDGRDGSVLSHRADDDNDDRHRRAPRSAAVSVTEAADAALKAAPGRVTSVDLEDDGGAHWDVEVTGAKGADRDVRVDAGTAAASVTADDDSHDSDDDRGGERDDRD
ncbi:PepSY domain-containing protein [uncultured Streptomyces sp.]|uniref:PepSY domain-containing protein n=1 Tax=uncultured Streptomyces sp. TaxID=174707 RepID=UPI002622B18A|nr:PepSY domain-containing protein [uncultured Streptomyces sp.]